jgi:hypothetical protein
MLNDLLIFEHRVGIHRSVTNDVLVVQSRLRLG